MYVYVCVCAGMQAPRSVSGGGGGVGRSRATRLAVRGSAVPATTRASGSKRKHGRDGDGDGDARPATVTKKPHALAEDACTHDTQAEVVAVAPSPLMFVVEGLPVLAPANGHVSRTLYQRPYRPYPGTAGYTPNVPLTGGERMSAVVCQSVTPRLTSVMVDVIMFPNGIAIAVDRRLDWAQLQPQIRLDRRVRMFQNPSTRVTQVLLFQNLHGWEIIQPNTLVRGTALFAVYREGCAQELNGPERTGTRAYVEGCGLPATPGWDSATALVSHDAAVPCLIYSGRVFFPYTDERIERLLFNPAYRSCAVHHSRCVKAAAAAAAATADDATLLSIPIHYIYVAPASDSTEERYFMIPQPNAAMFTDALDDYDDDDVGTEEDGVTASSSQSPTRPVQAFGGRSPSSPLSSSCSSPLSSAFSTPDKPPRLSWPSSAETMARVEAQNRLMVESKHAMTMVDVVRDVRALGGCELDPVRLVFDHVHQPIDASLHGEPMETTITTERWYGRDTRRRAVVTNDSKTVQHMIRPLTTTTTAATATAAADPVTAPVVVCITVSPASSSSATNPL